MKENKKEKLTVKPLFSNVLIKPLEASDKTKGGIILPDSAKEKPQMGLVMAVGAGATNEKGIKEKMTVKVGDRVMYKEWAGNKIRVNNEEWTMVEEKEILAIAE